MKIAFVGKGGSGKTTLSSLFIRHLAAQGCRSSPSTPTSTSTWPRRSAPGEPPPMGAHLPEIKEYLRGDNPRISSAAAMVKTTPPGRGRGCCGSPRTTRCTRWARPPRAARG